MAKQSLGRKPDSGIQKQSIHRLLTTRSGFSSKEASEFINLIIDDERDAEDARNSMLLRLINALGARLATLSESQKQLFCAISGNAVLGFNGNPTVIAEVAAADLNTPQTFAVNQTSETGVYSPDTGIAQPWAEMACLYTLTPTIADGTVPAPVLASAAGVFFRGLDSAQFTFGTGVGTYAAGVEATANITAVAGSLLTNADFFTLTDNVGLSQVFQFNDGTALVTPGNYPVPFDSGDTADEVAVSCRKLINGHPIDIRAAGATTAIDLTQNKVGAFAAATATEDVSNVGFVVAADPFQVANAGSADQVALGVAVESSLGALDNAFAWSKEDNDIPPATKTYVIR